MTSRPSDGAAGEAPSQELLREEDARSLGDVQIQSSDPVSLLEYAIGILKGPDGRGADRHKSLAITKIEEAIHWLKA